MTVTELEQQVKKLESALRFCRDMAAEELPYAPVGTGAEVVLRHIQRRCNETLDGSPRG